MSYDPTGIFGRRLHVLAGVPRVPGNLRRSGRTVRRTPPSTPSRPARPAAGHFVRDHIHDPRQSATPAGTAGAPGVRDAVQSEYHKKSVWIYGDTGAFTIPLRGTRRIVRFGIRSESGAGRPTYTIRTEETTTDYFTRFFLRFSLRPLLRVCYGRRFFFYSFLFLSERRLETGYVSHNLS